VVAPVFRSRSHSLRTRVWKHECCAFLPHLTHDNACIAERSSRRSPRPRSTTPLPSFCKTSSTSSERHKLYFQRLTS
jgi:hypothetical protein